MQGLRWPDAAFSPTQLPGTVRSVAGGASDRQAPDLCAGLRAEGRGGRAGEGAAFGVFLPQGERQAEAEEVRDREGGREAL